ncbi:MAG: dephospho-CoA kinase [Gammaproteobacteria bacterium]|nr:dephospho-CoA kinase [Gammaproteobacteria bacterium]
MLKIGLTGGIGSGKTTVAKFFRGFGIKVIDADKITRELTRPNQPALKKINKHFHAKVVSKTGRLNRKLLREIIFRDPSERRWLENLLHPLVYQNIVKEMRKVKSSYCVLVIPLLFETGAEKIVDRVLVIDSPIKLQIKRMLKRDQTTTTTAKAIINSQIKRKLRLKLADDVISNTGSLNQLYQKTKLMHEKYLLLGVRPGQFEKPH